MVVVWGGGKAAKPKANRGGARGGGKVVWPTRSFGNQGGHDRTGSGFNKSAGPICQKDIFGPTPLASPPKSL